MVFTRWKEKMMDLEVAPKNDNGKCEVCGKYNRDCGCHLCPECEEGILGYEPNCENCGYIVDEDE
jgi:hypothetical protein